MNNVAFQIYGSKRSGIFQSTWDTTLVSALGVETAAILASGTNWALNTGATNLNVGGYKHTAGSTTNLTTTLGATIMQTYQVTYTVSGRTAGSVTINYGGSTTSGITASSVATILATATTVFSITPTSDFDGVISISVKTSSSATNQIKLPLPNSGTYNIWVDWGDGTYNNITSYNSINTLHTYPAPGTYTVRITGDRFSWFFGYNIVNDKAKIKTISSWGKLKLRDQSFFGCSNLTMSGITDIPDLSTVTSLYIAFEACSSVTTIGRINDWNTSSITNMGGMFSGCTNFNSNISNWNVSNVTYFVNMFINCSKFNNGYAPGVYNQLPWTINTASNVDMQGIFYNASSFNANLGNGVTPWDVSKVTSMINMFNGASKFNNGFASGIANQLTWNTSSCTTMSATFNNCTSFNSNLGTGTTPWDVSKVTTFASMFQSASKFNNGDDSAPINNWNINSVSSVSMASMFQSSSNFNRYIGDWDVSKVTAMNNMFVACVLFNQPIGNWNTGNVTTMGGMFSSARLFNQDISKWNVGKVTVFTYMFYGNATTMSFNNGDNLDVNPVTGLQGIDGWNINTSPTASVSMAGMFYGTTGGNPFNRPIGSWNVSRVTTMGEMFVSCSFNQPLSNWERVDSTLANVISMNEMFRNTQSFNQDISSWNVGKVTTFASIFSGATAFNNGSDTNTNLVTLRTGIDGWNINTVSNVSMAGMFSNALAFNRPVDNWNMTKVNNTGLMFYVASKFNQSLANWERVGSTMGNNTSMVGMFRQTNDFNQPIGNWNTGNVTDMSAMFYDAKAFNQPIGSWNVSKVTSMSNMFFNAIAFNQPLDNWERVGSTTSEVTTMFGMFNGASIFNGLVDTWNVSKVTSMVAMFYNAPRFNQPLANWERVGSTLANVTLFSSANVFAGMFGLATDFNQPIGNWNTSKVTRMNYMFRNATNFNQPLNSWNTSSVWDMEGMFNNATLFNQPLGSWNVSNVTNFIAFMAGKTFNNFSSTNLDAIYNGWIVNGVKPNLSISFGTVKYTQAGKPGKDTLTSPVISGGYNWTITDGLLTVSGTSNNGGLIRVTTTAAHGFITGNSVYIYGVNGTTNANGTWTVTVVNTTVIELQGSTYNAAWTSGGNVILG